MCKIVREIPFYLVHKRPPKTQILKPKTQTQICKKPKSIWVPKPKTQTVWAALVDAKHKPNKPKPNIISCLLMIRDDVIL